MIVIDNMPDDCRRLSDGSILCNGMDPEDFCRQHGSNYEDFCYGGSSGGSGSGSGSSSSGSGGYRGGPTPPPPPPRPSKFDEFYSDCLRLANEAGMPSSHCAFMAAGYAFDFCDNQHTAAGEGALLGCGALKGVPRKVKRACLALEGVIIAAQTAMCD